MEMNTLSEKLYLDLNPKLSLPPEENGPATLSVYPPLHQSDLSPALQYVFRFIDI